MSDLTYEQRYEISLTVEFDGETITTTYAQCGSHKIKVGGRINIDHARELYAQLGALPGIDHPHAPRERRIT